MSNNESNFMIKYLIKIYGKNNKLMSTMAIPKLFKQFFTPQKYSQAMIESLNIDYPKRVIDLSMGEGSLLIESMNRWQNAEYIGNDIDSICCSKIENSYTNIKCFNLDIFDKNTIPIIKRKFNDVDLCLGNPPFHLIKQNASTRKILKEYGLDKKYKSLTIPAEVIFILQCLNILSESGTLSLILPDGFFVNTYLKYFRKFLISNYKIEQIVELPNNIFVKTDAKTHILTIKKVKSENSQIKLQKANTLSDIFINPLEAIERLDYSFYEKRNNYNNSTPLSNLDITFMRGKSKYLLTDLKEEHILHTTKFSKGKSFSNLLRTKKQLLKYEDKIAIPGDIVIARVGTYCLGKVGIIKKGYFVATDCIFVLRVNNITLRNKIYSLLVSEYGQSWIKANSKGVSAKHITLEDFKKFPYMEK